MEHKFPLESFHRENGTTFSEVPLIPEISSGTNQKVVSIYILIRIFWLTENVHGLYSNYRTKLSTNEYTRNLLVMVQKLTALLLPTLANYNKKTAFDHNLKL